MSEPTPVFDRRALLGSLTLLALGPRLLRAAGRSTQTSSRAAVTPRAPFLERPAAEPGTAFGNGLDGRLAFDLRRLADEGLVVSNRDFFVRTRAPSEVERRLQQGARWTVRFDAGADASGHLRDFGGAHSEISVDILQQRSRDMGRHLLECSGNSRRHCFGLLSVAEWSGVPLRELAAETLGNLHRSALIRVSGNDQHSGPSRASIPGASWIFTLEQIESTGAFLATAMGGEPLPLDHGAPVRLIVPGWYGCTCIKWVEAVEVVSTHEPSTSQMLEFSSRTHQQGRPALARDFAPADIDFAAMPILVEGPEEDGGYRVTGVAWGDPKGVEGLAVRYRNLESPRPMAQWLPVPDFVAQAPSSWTLWLHRFVPERSGEHEIVLRAEGAEDLRSRRLDRGYYARRARL